MTYRTQGAKKFLLRLNAPNLAAFKLYEKLGFEVEGRLRNQIFIDGQFQDIIIMAKMA